MVNTGILSGIIALIFSLSVSSAFSFELTPIAGYRIGGALEDGLTNIEMELIDSESYGVIINFDLSPGKKLEFLYSHQETSVQISPTFVISPEWNIDVDYFHIGGLNTFNSYGTFKPFVAGGIGLTHVDPDRFNPVSRLSLSLAGGGKLFMSDNVGLRLEARSYWTFFDSSSTIFCNNGGCQVFVESDTWWQFETNIGVFFRF
jgi:hypothetical protein